MKQPPQEDAEKTQRENASVVPLAIKDGRRQHMQARAGLILRPLVGAHRDEGSQQHYWDTCTTCPFTT